MIMWTYIKHITVVLFVYNIASAKCNGQIGPDPWDYSPNINSINHGNNIPPDLRAIPTKKVQTNNMSTGEWFYKRILAIILKGGLVQKNEDGSVDISLQMRFDAKRWSIIEEYISSNTALSDDMFRRSLGYVEEAIYKPTITEKIVMAWTEYVQFYLIEYKAYIVGATSILGAIGLAFWLLHHMSHKHVIILLFVGFYMYEVIVSYKEAEKQELDRFITSVNTCKWFIWSSTCEVPPPDPLIFLKHMNPLKIGIRMFSVVISEPMITISETVKTITHGITDGLWFPFDKLFYGMLMLIFNILILFLLVMILFNYILNIPFNLNFLGVINIGLNQRNRTFPKDNNNDTSTLPRDNIDRMSGETLSRFLDVCSKALNITQSANLAPISDKKGQGKNLSIAEKPKMSRSASTSRLPNFVNN